MDAATRRADKVAALVTALDAAIGHYQVAARHNPLHVLTWRLACVAKQQLEDWVAGRADERRWAMSRGLEQGIHLLEAIAEAGPGGTSQSDLARKLNTSEATISRLSATLEALGYIERMALGVRLGKLAAQLWLAYRKGLKIERATIDAALRATAIAEEPPADHVPGQAEHGGAE